MGLRNTISIPFLFLVCSGCGCTESSMSGTYDGDVATDIPMWDMYDIDTIFPDTTTPDIPVTDTPSVDIWYPDSWDATEGTLPGCAGIPADIVVPRDFASIQSAISAARNGDLVCVDPGIYHENLVISGKDIHVLGIAGPYFTIVDAGFHGTVLSVSDVGSSMVFQGFTLRHGYGWDGGGVKVDGGSPTFAQVHVIDNLNGGFGCGLSIGRGSPLFMNAIVAGNITESGFGGGMHIQGDARPSFHNVVVAWNETWEGFGGGAFIERGTTTTMTNVIFAGNLDSSGFGGGISMNGEGSMLALTNVTMYGNEVRSGMGGAIHADWEEPGVRLINVDIIGNSSDSMGGGIHTDDPSSIALSHCNLWGNIPDDIAGMPDPTGTDGNISEDPMLLDTSGEFPLDWDLHIGATSRLVNAGDPAILDPDGSRSDIGAFGGPGGDDWDLDADGFPAWWQPGPYDHSTYPALGLDCNDMNPLVYPGSGC
jgi:hypothetical protein